MRPVILDTDIGSDVDDLLALVFILRSRELALQGVTTVYGDTRRRARLAKVVCGLSGEPELPVIPGQEKPLSGRQVYWAGIEGEGVAGLDDVKLDAENGADAFLLSQAEARQGELEILAIGPLTNIARAIEREPRFCRWIKRLYLMGGTFYDDRPEHNIRCDTVAAAKVFGSGMPTVALGLDVTMIPSIREKDVLRLEGSSDPLSRLAAEQIRRWWLFRHDAQNNPHDPLAALAMERPDLFRFETCGVQVQLDGPFYGRTYRVKTGPLVEVASDVFSHTALELIIDRLAYTPSQDG
ncbi:MAG: nucleoside hydrolase [Verrucomicrobia bacterium]|nr:nucleoside hydrolase [Verrucomicrobiota bacterium]